MEYKSKVYFTSEFLVRFYSFGSQNFYLMTKKMCLLLFSVKKERRIECRLLVIG